MVPSAPAAHHRPCQTRSGPESIWPMAARRGTAQRQQPKNEPAHRVGDEEPHPEPNRQPWLDVEPLSRGHHLGHLLDQRPEEDGNHPPHEPKGHHPERDKEQRLPPPRAETCRDPSSPGPTSAAWSAVGRAPRQPPAAAMTPSGGRARWLTCGRHRSPGSTTHQSAVGHAAVTRQPSSIDPGSVARWLAQHLVDPRRALGGGSLGPLVGRPVEHGVLRSLGR